MPNRHLLNDSASEKLIGEGMKEEKRGKRKVAAMPEGIAV